jgi:hypothetical protein
MAIDPVQRKLAYLRGLASEDGIALSMDKWLAKLKEIQMEISYDVIWRILMDLYLKLQLGIDWSDFDFPPIEPIIIPPIIIPPIPPPPPPPPPPIATKAKLYGLVYDSKSHASIFSGTVSGAGATPFSVSFLNGMYFTGELDEGPYSVTASAIGYGSSYRSVTLIAGQILQQDFELVRDLPPPDKGRVYGAVFERTTGNLIGGGTVEGTGASPFTATIINGLYDSGNLDGGTYALLCTSEGYKSVSLTVNVVNGENLKQDFPLDRMDDPVDIQKGVYDVTYYDLCYFDPPELALVDLERFAWAQRYRIAEKNTLEYRKQSLALKTLIESDKDSFKNVGITPTIVDNVETIAAMVESRVLRGFYVGFAVVGLSRVSERHQPEFDFRARVDTRRFENWKDIVASESVVSHEPLVGYGRVGHFRVANYLQMLSKQLSDEAVRKISDFWLRSGLVEAGEVSRYGGLGYFNYGVPSYAGYLPVKYETLYQRTFMLQRVDQYHYEGGHHQIILQTVLKKVRTICNKQGVIGTFRSAYTSYAQEIYYQKYEGHRLWKTWKRLVSVEDITNKYIQMGCDTTVLNKIKDAVVP